MNSVGNNADNSSPEISRSSTPLSNLRSTGCESCANSTNMSLLETEAFAAVREISSFVHSICISEVLTRTPELIFLNLVTVEGECYCLELTQKGWRICSDRQDCMYGDFRKLELHSKYFETIYQLLDFVSAGYRQRFANQLSEKLNNTQMLAQ
uniref:GSKIP domain-containing protein n=1 Tax=Ditylenchus dipsaci TaxID=166011 RepID=A0A915D5J0_9BILA